MVAQSEAPKLYKNRSRVINHGFAPIRLHKEELGYLQTKKQIKRLQRELLRQTAPNKPDQQFNKTNLYGPQISIFGKYARLEKQSFHMSTYG